jgi:hypothetical protein
VWQQIHPATHKAAGRRLPVLASAMQRFHTQIEGPQIVNLSAEEPVLGFAEADRVR